MNGLPPALKQAIRDALGLEPLRVTPVGGGMISRAAKIETTQGTLFVKWNEAAPPGMFTAEWEGLAALRATQTLRVPDVLVMQDGVENAPSFLVMEYIESRPPSDPERFAQRFGEGLADLHQSRSGDFGGFGFPQDNFIGSLPQKSTPHPDWATFYRDCRLLPQIEMARERGHLPATRESLLMRVVERLETLLDDMDTPPALIHGDLWSGNFLSVDTEPVLIDPSAYYAAREMEIAYMELFGGFPAGVLLAYRAAYPLDAGYERRRPLHQLYHLINHLNHFGETYGADVDAACHHYL